ncbi:hypothetical protein HEP87_10965 [Streptomyces sp. S1D4-11]|nr:hypothetical protein [Streptomyces sp. S1D4-11]QIY94444.1 hypothetical protein HEP87_10965 [Streptomyces sp. S1D4-11]
MTVELAAMPVGEPQAGLWLVRAGGRAAHRLIYAAQRARRTATVPLDENVVPLHLASPGSAEVFAVLERAANARIITKEEAELIAQTRLERQVMAKAASAVGLSGAPPSAAGRRPSSGWPPRWPSRSSDRRGGTIGRRFSP